MTDSNQMIVTETEKVSYVAQRLNISEFDLFAKAYREWFHTTGERPFLERKFTRYLYLNEMPFWVRHFLRRFPVDQGPILTRSTETSKTGIWKYLLFWLIPGFCFCAKSNPGSFTIVV